MRCFIQHAAIAALWMITSAFPMFSSASADSTAYVSSHSSTSLLSALGNKSVSTVVLTTNYNLGELLPEEHASLNLDRNVTITGLPGQMPVLDLGFKPEVVALCSACQLTFVDVAIANDRRGTGQVLESISSEGLGSVVLLHNVVRLRPACTSAADSGDVIKETGRSSAVPTSSSGQQEYEVQDVTFEGQAYPSSLVLRDVSINYPLMHQEGRVHYSKYKGHFGGYTVWERNVTRLCAHIASQQCLQRKSAESCVSDLIDEVQAAAAAAAAATASTPDAQASTNYGLIAVAVVLPIVLIGLLIAGIFVIGKGWLQRQQQHRQKQLAASSKDGSGTSRDDDNNDVEKQQPGNITPTANSEPSHLCHADSATESMLQRKVSVHVQLMQAEGRPPLGGSMQGWNVASISTSPFVGPVEDVRVEFGELLGTGSFGRVYRARWCDQDVAVKVIEHDVNTLVAVEAEAELALSLNHPNLVRAYHYVTYTQDAHATCSASVSSSQGSHMLRQPSVWTDTQSETAVCNDSAMGNNTGPCNSIDASSLQPAGSSQQLAMGSSIAVPSKGSNPCISGVAMQLGSAASSGRQAAGAAATTTGSISTLERTTSSWTTGGKPAKAETWLVLEYCDRGTLGSVAETWNQRGEGDEQMLERLLLLRDVARGLVALHKECVVHADLNARNVLVSSCADSQNGLVAKLADLGLSRVIRQHATHRTTNTVGTISHQPPEMLRYGRMSPAVDLYSMGIMMWEVYTGQMAFPKLHYGQFFETVVLQNLRPVVPQDMPQDYAMLMRQCWAAEPTDRPSAQQLLAALEVMVKSRQAHLAAATSGITDAAAVTSSVSQLTQLLPVLGPAASQQQHTQQEHQHQHNTQCLHEQADVSSCIGSDASWKGFLNQDAADGMSEPPQGPPPSSLKSVRWQHAPAAHDSQVTPISGNLQNVNTSWFV